MSKQIYHLAGTETEKRGVQAAVKKVYAALPDNKFVFRTDVKGYYASIDHSILFGLCRKYIKDPFILRLIREYLKHTVHDQQKGIVQTIQKGISLGCPLSPLMGALCLKPLDDAMEKTGLFYLRFMDDWVVLSLTRWKLKKAIATVNQCLNALVFDKHPDKTYIGRITNGFDFLGYHFKLVASTTQTTKGEMQPSIVPAQKTIDNFINKLSRLYEQNVSAGRIEKYIYCWYRTVWIPIGDRLKEIPSEACEILILICDLNRWQIGNYTPRLLISS